MDKPMKTLTIKEMTGDEPLSAGTRVKLTCDYTGDRQCFETATITGVKLSDQIERDDYTHIEVYTVTWWDGKTCILWPEECVPLNQGDKYIESKEYRIE